MAYLSELFANGHIKAAASGANAALAVADLPEAIAAADSAARLEFPPRVPALSMESAVWAGTIFYHACRFLVYRDIGPALVEATLSCACPQAPSPSSAYSVDLTFRYLPDLLALARGVAEEDPLVQGLLVLARHWPLSSVGISLPAGVDPSPFIADACLRKIYAERILSRNDVSRLNHPAVRAAIREAIGLHPELNPAIARALDEFAGR